MQTSIMRQRIKIIKSKRIISLYKTLLLWPFLNKIRICKTPIFDQLTGL